KSRHRLRGGRGTLGRQGRGRTTGDATASNAESGAEPANRLGGKLLSDEYVHRVVEALFMRRRQHKETVSREGTGLAGKRRRDLIEWCVSQQNEKTNNTFPRRWQQLS
ncbi:hypothetical protein C3L33_09104, partial [Rhododendron williamsianum]